MGRKKIEEKEEGAYWMDTYGDMVTLLLTFFVLLFAMSSIDSDKYEIFVRAFNDKFSTKDQFVIVNEEAEEEGMDNARPTGDESTVGITEEIDTIEDVEKFDDIYLFLKQYFEEQGMEEEIIIKNGDGFVYIRFDNSIFFAPDDYQLIGETTKLLQIICDVTSQIPHKIGEIHAHGHTAQDNETIPNNIQVDRMLSSSRATNVIIYLEENGLVTGERLKSQGHGQHSPLVPHDGLEETRKKNRRCELVIAEQGKEPPTLSQIYESLNAPENFEGMDLPPIVAIDEPESIPESDGDAGVDTEPDAGVDTEPDAGTDTEPDAGVDTEPDAGVDGVEPEE